MEAGVTIEDQVRELMHRSLPAYVEILDEGISFRSPLDFLGMLEKLCALLMRTESVIQKDARNLCPVIYVDYGVSDELQTLVREGIGEGNPERVLLYLIEGLDFLDMSGEIYATKIPLPGALGESCELTFACFRDEESIANDWEYNIGLYVVRKSFSRQVKN